MKRLRWQFVLGVSLVALSAVLYFIHYVIFHDAHHIFIYLMGDVAFVPIEVLLVTIIIHQLLGYREKQSMLKKLNMVIGAFFSEVGTHLLKSLSDFDPRSDAIRRELVPTNDWSDDEFSRVSKHLKSYDYTIECKKGDLEALKTLLVGKRNFLLRLLENPNLLEHESFTELLWAVFHLTEELASRPDVTQLPDTDRAHIAGDIKRASGLLTCEWLAYMKHLKDDYPYLFSLAMRTNPFDLSASPVVS